jgi:hypothetical protein
VDGGGRLESTKSNINLVNAAALCGVLCWAICRHGRARFTLYFCLGQQPRWNDSKSLFFCSIDKNQAAQVSTLFPCGRTRWEASICIQEGNSPLESPSKTVLLVHLVERRKPLISTDSPSSVRGRSCIVFTEATRTVEILEGNTSWIPVGLSSACSGEPAMSGPEATCP